MHRNCQPVELLKYLKTETHNWKQDESELLLLKLLKLEKNKIEAENMTKSELLFQELLKHRKSVKLNAHDKMHRNVLIHLMAILCLHPRVFKFQQEKSWHVNLSPLTNPPDPVLTHIAGVSQESENYLHYIWKHNACFQMDSLGVVKFAEFGNLPPTFELQRHEGLGN